MHQRPGAGQPAVGAARPVRSQTVIAAVREWRTSVSSPKPGLPRWLLAAALTLSWIGGVAGPQAWAAPRGALPVLTTARRVHSLTPKEAGRHYPVSLSAVVTYYDPYIDPRHGALFVHDATGAIFVAIAARPIRSERSRAPLPGQPVGGRHLLRSLHRSQARRAVCARCDRRHLCRYRGQAHPD